MFSRTKGLGQCPTDGGAVQPVQTHDPKTCPAGTVVDDLGHVYACSLCECSSDTEWSSDTEDGVSVSNKQETPVALPATTAVPATVKSCSKTGTVEFSWGEDPDDALENKTVSEAATAASVAAGAALAARLWREI